MTSLDGSLALLFANLTAWRGLPKYALERRIDIFLSPFLAEYVGSRLGCPGQLELVVPEFPIRHGASFQSVNADYLLYRRDRPTWYLLELKTDRLSVGDRQHRIYQQARAREGAMRAMLADIQAIRDHARGAARLKYDALLKLLPGDRDDRAAVETIYLSPSRPVVSPDHFFRLRELSEWRPQEHAELWAHLVPLLSRLDDGAPHRGDPLEWFRAGMGPGTVRRVVTRNGEWVAVDVACQAGCIVGPEAEGAPIAVTRLDREEYERREREWRLRPE